MWVEVRQFQEIIRINQDERKTEDVYVVHGVDRKGIACVWYDPHLGKWIFPKHEVADISDELNYLRMDVSVRPLQNLFISIFENDECGSP